MRSEGAGNLAESVRDFYEHHPYPPPVDDLDRYRKRWDDPLRRRADTHLFWPDKGYREDRSILVAGCGTSQAAKYASRWPRAKVTGIDVSANSIQRTEKLRSKHKLENLELRQLPVERAGELGSRYDHVVSTGVLHHLPDPAVGLRSLRDVLEPEGTLHLMVYAPYGRTGVYMLQEYCRRLNIDTTPSAIRDLVASLKALPPDHPLLPLLRKAPDFQSEAGIADALLHPHDRSYSVPELFEFIHDAGLQFGRWLRQAPYLPECGALASSPHVPLLSRLPAEQQYAAVELFRGTMVRHSAILFRDDLPGSAQPVHFDGDAWLDYVPIRLPDSICIEERLPVGAAAVLINRSHAYTDIYLPINAQEKGFFGAIDGARNIGEIARANEQLDAARAFFERLWHYDQVVFDTSQGRNSATGKTPDNLTDQVPA